MKGIYKITNLKNQKFYIGQSKDLNNREHSHFYRLGRNEHHNGILQKSFNKHGEENFIFEVLEEIDFDNFLNEREKYWLDFHGGLNNKKIYNMKNPLTNEYSDYTKVKVSKIMLGENNPNFGNKWTDEQKENLSKKKKGKTLEERIGTEKSKLAKEPVQQLTKDGVLVREYEFLSQVKSYGFDISNVTSVCRGRFKSCGGFIWKYK